MAKAPNKTLVRSHAVLLHKAAHADNVKMVEVYAHAKALCNHIETEMGIDPGKLATDAKLAREAAVLVGSIGL